MASLTHACHNRSTLVWFPAAVYAVARLETLALFCGSLRLKHQTHPDGPPGEFLAALIRGEGNVQLDSQADDGHVDGYVVAMLTSAPPGPHEHAPGQRS